LNLFKRLKVLGPALVLAAVVLGPGSLTLSTIAGSVYGYRLLWIPVVATVFMLTYTWMSAKIGLVTGETLFQVSRRKYGPVVTGLAGLFGFLAILAFQAGNTAAIGFAAQAFLGSDVRLWAALFYLIALGLLFLPDLYPKLEILVKFFVGMMILSFVGTLFVVGVDTGQAVRGLLPGFPNPAAIFLGLGIVATTFPVVAAVYQTYLMREKQWGVEQLREEGFESFVGIFILGAIATVILLTSAGAIHGVIDPVFSAEGMALQLEPLAGPAAFYLFTIGFFFASISSMIVNPLIGATLLVDGFNQDASMNARPVKIWTAVALTAGLAVVFIFRGSPIEILRIAQAMTIIAFPLLGFLVLAIANDTDIMGEYRNSLRTNILGILGYLTILGIVFNYLRTVIEMVR